MLLSYCVEVAFQNILKASFFPALFVHVAFMLRPGRFPKRFKNLVFSQVFVHVAFMLCPCCFPKRIKNLVVSQVFVHVAFMLRPCCFPKHFKNLMFSQVFVHVAVMLHSISFQKISRTWRVPRFWRMLLSCCVHVAFPIKIRVFSQVLVHIFKITCILFSKPFKNLVFSPDFFYIYYLHIASALLSKYFIFFYFRYCNFFFQIILNIEKVFKIRIIKLKLLYLFMQYCFLILF